MYSGMVIKGGNLWAAKQGFGVKIDKGYHSGKIPELHGTINRELLHSVLGCYSDSMDFY